MIEAAAIDTLAQSVGQRSLAFICQTADGHTSKVNGGFRGLSIPVCMLVKRSEGAVMI